MSSKTRMTVAEFVQSFAERAENYTVPEHRVNTVPSPWQTRQIDRLNRINSIIKADLSEFDYEPVDFADADYILKGLSANLCSAVKQSKQSTAKARRNGVKAAEQVIAASKPQAQIDWQALCLDGTMGLTAKKRARALVS